MALDDPKLENLSGIEGILQSMVLLAGNIPKVRDAINSDKGQSLIDLNHYEFNGVPRHLTVTNGRIGYISEAILQGMLSFAGSLPQMKKAIKESEKEGTGTIYFDLGIHQMDGVPKYIAVKKGEIEYAKDVPQGAQIINLGKY